MTEEYTLYSYWRSSASYRVRIALEVKGIQYEYVPINLVKGEQQSAEYIAMNPSGLVPALVVANGCDSFVLTQSLAMIEYLDEKHPEGPPLLPSDPFLRAKAREIAYAIACDIHPRQNLRVLREISDETQRAQAAKQVIREGLQAVEALLSSPTAVKYCVGEALSIADLVLVPQVYNAIRWGVNMNEFPKISSIHRHLITLDPFKRAHPDVQPDKN